MFGYDDQVFYDYDYEDERDDAQVFEELNAADEELDPAAYSDNLLVLPHDWPAPAFAFGEHALVAEHAREHLITGMKLDLIDEESGVTPAAVWMYLVCGRWYQEDELSQPEPTMSATTSEIDDFDPFLDAEDLP